MRAGILGKKARRGEQDFYLQITSLIDTLVIILVFMLMTIGSGSVNLEMASNIKLPWSTQGADLTQGLKLVARMDGVSLEQEAIVPMKDGVIAHNLTSEDGKKVTVLFQKMLTKAQESRKAADKTGVKFEGKVLVQADKAVPLKTIKQLLYTAARAGYNDFKFAVVRQ
ncbi:MAG: biopolymer transporter ExbD [Deltaproteobacteria bacterium]|nr:biopolymer transporter ExbD [Deltaproteobacteria bacterium]